MAAQSEVRKPEYHIDVFMDYFIAALVLRGKDHVHLRRERAAEERRRLYVLYKYLDELVEAADQSNKDWYYFIVRLRNKLSPGNIGSFDGFFGELLRKTLTLVSFDLPFCDYYKIGLGHTWARSCLAHAEPAMHELAEKAADVYMLDLAKE